MHHARPLRRAVAATAAALAASFGVATAGALPASADPVRDTVYTLSNATAASGGNEVLAYRAVADGSLVSIGGFPTGGNGNGSALGSQGSVVVGDHDRLLAAVNASSNSVSLLKIRNDGRLRLLTTAASAGTQPISVAIDGHNLYVLNAGSNTVAGFSIDGKHLRPTDRTPRALSPGAAGPAEVAVSGGQLLVTEKASNTIDTFPLDHHGGIGSPISRPSGAPTPFGFSFDRYGHAIVSDAGSGPGTAAVSSYGVTPFGTVNLSNVPDTQTAACWIAIAPDGTHAYTTNAGSGTVSSYDIAPTGLLSLRHAVATTVTGHPSDAAVGGTSPRLYVLENTGQRITAASVASNGDLGPSTNVVTGLPASAVGLAATQS
jgi:6-phosphogluconolactonase (cycloisomerase 2 family)